MTLEEKYEKIKTIFESRGCVVTKVEDTVYLEREYSISRTIKAALFKYNHQSFDEILESKEPIQF